MSGVLVAVLWF